MQGTLVYAVPGRTTAEPASGARVQLANSALETFAGEDGYFRLENLATPGGSLLIQLDVDGDGQPDRQRRLDLAAYGGGFGKDVSLGTVLLGRNATVVGAARRGDKSTESTGHAGTSVFVPEGPFAAQTADDGSFTLENMPEGPLTLAFFRPGYESTVQSTTLRAGERLQLEPVLLAVKTTADLPGTLSGTVLQADASPASGASVSVPGLADLATTDAEGRFTASLPAGLYAVTVAKAGFVTVVVPNVLVASGVTAQIGVVLVPVGSGAGGGGGATGGGGGTTGGGGGTTGGGGGTTGGGGGTTGGGGGTTGGGGGTTGGGGGSDAGVDDGGTGGGSAGDAGIDGGTDAGTGPVAVIEPHPASFLPWDLVVLNGSLSSGVQPLSYTWRQLLPTDGGVALTDYVSGSGNGTTSGFEIRTSLWYQVGRYELELKVTDALGRESAPATTSFIVSAAPTAVITGVSPAAIPTAVGSGEVFTLSGATSVDGNSPALPLVQYSWSAVSGAPVLTPNAAVNGREVQVRAPIVSSPTIMRLRLQVTNAFGLTAEADSPDIVVRPLDDAGTWQLAVRAASAGDAGTTLTVPSLAAVTLVAQAITTIPDAGFTFSWSPQADPDAGWSLTGPNSAQASFVAPKVVGATRTLQFTATVSAPDAGLIPAQRTGQVTVAVVDEDPPAVASTTFPSGTGSIFGVTVTFDEDIDFGTYTYADVLDAQGGVVGDSRIVKGRSLVFKPTQPWVVGQTYRVRIRSVVDRSPAQNMFPANYDTTYLTFVGALGVSEAFESTDRSANEPFPALLLRRAPAPTDGGVGQQPVVQLIGRRSATSPGAESAWFLQSRPAYSFGCGTPPCLVSTLTGGPTPALVPDAGVPIKRSFVINDQPVGVLEVGATSDAGVAVLVTTDLAGNPSLVTAVGAPLGPVGPGPVGLVSAGVASDGTLGFAAVDRFTNTWVEASPGTFSDWRAGGQLAVTAIANHQGVVGQSASNGFGRVGWGTSAGWLALEVTSTPATSPRTFFATQGTTQEFWAFMLAEFVDNSVTTTRLYGRHFTRDETILWLSGTYDAIESTWITSYDVLRDDGLVWIAYVTAGQLRVRAWSRSAYSYSIAYSTLVPGPHADGVMNTAPSCVAAQPELLADEAFLFLAWQERCPGQDWKMVYRVLH